MPSDAALLKKSLKRLPAWLIGIKKAPTLVCGERMIIFLLSTNLHILRKGGVENGEKTKL